ncbi:MAG: phosphopantothenoylcysteine decarboxylase [Candidatus Methylacidiphilales bacterium]|nr:phosphopantothenoylcysteine decarboxylase [Candidatus Methylacidiphilales bacterium]
MSDLKNVLVTCGPTYEPIDEVRRLTNFSTGRHGAVIVDSLAAAGWHVTVLRGVQSTFAPPKHGQILPFTTRDSLKAELIRLSKEQEFAAVFHAAAVGDFEINAILDIDNQPVIAKKISGSSQEIKLLLKPAPKLIRNLRGWFPKSVLVGWKYELEGKRPQAVQKAWKQMVDCDSDACVANGTAYGEGFGFCTQPAEHAHFETEESLIRHIVTWLPEATTIRQTSVRA